MQKCNAYLGMQGNSGLTEWHTALLVWLHVIGLLSLHGRTCRVLTPDDP